jgi:hypothetical protein
LADTLEQRSFGSFAKGRGQEEKREGERGEDADR